MSETFGDILTRIFAQDTIDDNDVLTLRRALYGDGHISVQEANRLFDLSDTVPTKTDSFGEFFMEAMTDFIVRQSLPYGYVDDANASWLMARISKDGHVETITELRLLVNVLNTATDCPDRLIGFALAQVKQAVLFGEGVIGRGRSLSPGHVSAADVEILRNMIYASGGDNHIAVTRVEAQALFELNAATRGADNDPGWRDLFVKAIANYLMFLTSYNTPDRNEALRRDQWLKQRGDLSLGNMIKNLRFKDFAAQITGGQDEPQNKNGAESALAERIDADEAGWIIESIGQDGVYDENEQALMDFLAAESPYLHQSLLPLLSAA
ncbi:hypothetical protein [Robiginitomaculum antarcticum]|uniref:hypothetical protein n=1 Tax=Robiginitomaculum antarcticum TaxID=437507 RepID=UPI00035CFC1B|nr:hypothetical protein [Robiginitomaculum antarcticum]